ncbi:FKBP-type peptidyl-prolyl cis-trans isomerase [Yersinia pseudotuberculosis]|uniref:Peptidyl-prolyl cis-trans isomerase n=8 Tax=Yersinia pseudotuberculosis complex TaxID=1649845 RepID=Q8CZP4_YERPE|nr:FKBP-type peptidyl-prolyl cis-trans isomerase [Yersinia pestis]AAM87246.1 probable FKBX-type 16KD peptidyl-prolyl cis-trans isomerase [Yersinia pestis KIM10+]AAS63851.1 putative FKBX-type 16KD peptidyl-prolyl cis-trans isomerase [Yersinia pestis biovar Microtus str. 91001]ABG16031.1 FKBP-type peptidyl-prolyl cis-trans isomerase [Yersinia pestis Antiqua]ABG16681.1 FKBP-type peptidyl-prolyl cis-trans isomerase [Yersinia pestis Nepal516]ABP41513.1 FKBP-type peptidyl-prolyl cis-trans isomerase 
MSDMSEFVQDTESVQNTGTVKTTTAVQNNGAVLVHFTLKLEDGSTAESTRTHGKPALFRLGDNSLSDALEQQLLGLTVGDKHAFTLRPEDAFGVENPDLIQYFTPRDFAETGVPDAGTIMLFSSRDGSEMPGVVREVAEESITVDFNHPLAGHSVSFELEILEIDPQQEVVYADIAG